MKQRILFAVGGTGGHLFPAIGIAQQIQQKDSSIEILFAGGGTKQDSSFPYHRVPSASLSLAHPWKMVRNGIRILKGISQAKALLRSYDPSLIIGFGSHYALPLLCAARMQGIPYILHEQNVIPGRVVRFFSRKALFTGLHLPVPEGRLNGKTRIVGMPLREGYFRGAVDRQEAYSHFGLKSDKSCVLIFGGSQGALGINRWITRSLEGKKNIPFHVIHLTGDSKQTESLSRLYASRGISACVKDYEPEMHKAWEIADCVISRAGASSIAEQIEYEVPAILIPYPHAMDNHQEHNANFFVQQVGGGIKRPEAAMDAENLFATLEQLDFAQLQENIRRFKRERTQENFADEILRTIRGAFGTLC